MGYGVIPGTWWVGYRVRYWCWVPVPGTVPGLATVPGYCTVPGLATVPGLGTGPGYSVWVLVLATVSGYWSWLLYLATVPGYGTPTVPGYGTPTVPGYGTPCTRLWTLPGYHCDPPWPRCVRGLGIVVRHGCQSRAR